MEKKQRAVAYSRVSSREQAEKELSIPAQLEAIRKYCKEKGWELVHEYIDAGKSAKTDDRPEFQKMITMAKRQNRNFDIIVVHKFDRFSRNRDDHVIYKSLLKKLGVSVHSLTEQTDPETPHGFLLEGIMEVISEFYNMNLSNEVKKGMAENAKKGYHNGGTPPYGYRIGKIHDINSKEKSVWVLGPEDEQRTIRQIFNLYVNLNKGYKAIAGILNDEKIPSPSGGLWSWNTIWHILHNDAYIGRRIWNRYDYTNGKKEKPKDEWIIRAEAHAPIIDRDTFNAVEIRSKERNPTGAAYKGKGPSLFILRGLLKCPMCDANMVTGSNSKNSRGYTKYYHCGTYHRKGSKACKRNGVPKAKLESGVLNALVREFSLLIYPGSLEDEFNKYIENLNRDATYNLLRINDELKYLNNRLNAVRKDDMLEKNNDTIRDYIADLENQISQLEEKKNPWQILSQLLLSLMKNCLLSEMSLRTLFLGSTLKDLTGSTVFLRNMLIM